MTNISIKPRWVYRFDNFNRALNLLNEALIIMDERNLSQLELEGVIQRFEYTWELTWKVIKDYLEFKGVVFDTITPADVLKTAVATNLIYDGELWMEALDARNKMSHTYNFKKFEQVIVDVKDKYFPLLISLKSKLANIHD